LLSAPLRSGAVRGYPPAETVLLAGPEGPNSYRTAMFYLPEYWVIALGRGRAGELFSNRPGAPEYDLTRLDQVGRLRSVTIDDPLARHLFSVELDPRDPPIARRSWIHLRSSDYYQFRRPGRSCEALPRWSCPSASWPGVSDRAGS
jgi:hypothetical protein